MTGGKDRVVGEAMEGGAKNGITAVRDPEGKATSRPGVHLRRAVAADASAIAALEAECAHAPWSQAQVASSLALETTEAWLLLEVEGIASKPKVQGSPIGYLLGSSAGGAAEVLIVGVLPVARRRGFGRRLVSAAMDAWREGGIEEAFLEVRASNTAAQGLYAALGWEEISVRRRYYGDGMDAVVMRWLP